MTSIYTDINTNNTNWTEDCYNSDWTEIRNHRQKYNFAYTISNSSKSFTNINLNKSRYSMNQQNNNMHHIKEWASSILSLSERIDIFEANKNNWIKKETETNNKYNIIKFLAKSHQAEMLSYIIKKYPDFSKNLLTYKDKFTPIQHACWASTRTFKINSKAIINTIDVLINEYKYRIFTIYEQETDDKKPVYETVLGTLICENNKLNKKIKMELYDYITDTTHSRWFISEFKTYLNKIDERNYLKFLNKILFISRKYCKEICPILFKYLLGVKISRIELNEKIDLIIGILTSTPTSQDNELNLYFKKNKIDSSYYDELVDTLLANADDWICIDNIENSDEITPDDMEVIQITSAKTNEINYKIYYSILGSFYRRSINKEKIIEKILNDIFSYKTTHEDCMDYKWINKALIQFISHAKLDYSYLTLNEKYIIKTLAENYFSPCFKMHERFNIGYILSLMYYKYDNSESNKILQAEIINELFIENL